MNCGSQQSKISELGLHIESGWCPLESEPLHLSLVHWHMPGWLGFSCTARGCSLCSDSPRLSASHSGTLFCQVLVFYPPTEDPEQDSWVAGQQDGFPCTGGRPQLSRTTECKENWDLNVVSFWQWGGQPNTGETSLLTPATLCYMWFPAKSHTSISPCGLGSSLCPRKDVEIMLEKYHGQHTQQ